MELPNANYLPDHDYGGQHFVKYISTEEKIQWQPWRLPGFEYQDTRIGI